MKAVCEFLPWQEMNFNQTVILNDNPENESYLVGALGKMSEILMAFCINPRSGKISYIDDFETKIPFHLYLESEGWGSEFLLILLIKEIAQKMSLFFTE